MKTRCSLCISSMILVFVLSSARGQVVYVDASAEGANSGVDWANAYTSLQTAIAATTPPTSIWVAKGTYVPGANRTDSFTLKNAMQIYGGFTNGMTSLTQRDWNANPTILSGEIQGDSDINNNTYHIVAANTNGVLNGFVVTGGMANGTDPHDKGGAVYASYVGRDNSVNWPQSIANCVFTNNTAVSGGAIYGNYSNFFITNSVFAMNVATNGGAMYFNQFTNNRKIEIVDTILRQNRANSQGGAIYGNAFQKWPITRCRFLGNTAGSSGGAVYNTSSWMADGLYDCLFVGNTAGGTGNGGAVNYGNPGLNIYRSTFVMNSSGGGSGGAIAPFNANPSIAVLGSRFIGNLCKSSGGALHLNARGLVAANCLFAGNVSTNGSGGGAYLTPNTGSYKAELTGCTFAGNWAKVSGGGQYATDGRAITNVNSILWGNTATASKTPSQITGTSAYCRYTDVQGGVGSWRQYHGQGSEIRPGALGHVDGGRNLQSGDGSDGVDGWRGQLDAGTLRRRLPEHGHDAVSPDADRHQHRHDDDGLRESQRLHGLGRRVSGLGLPPDVHRRALDRAGLGERQCEQSVHRCRKSGEFLRA